MPVVDTHVHIWEPASERYPWQPIGRLHPDFYWTAEEQVAAMAEAGVDHGIIVQTSWYGFDNRYGLASMVAHPGRFAYVGMVDPRQPDAADEMARLAEAGAGGLRVPALMRPDLACWDMPHAEALWQKAGDLGLVLCLFVNAQQAVDAALTIERHPEVKVVIDHLARPDLDEPPGGPGFRALLSLSRLPNLYLKASAAPAISRQGAPYDDVAGWVRAAFDAYGPRRLMWGTDHAMTQRIAPFSMAKATAWLDATLAAQSESDRAWVRGGTAVELFRL